MLDLNRERRYQAGDEQGAWSWRNIFPAAAPISGAHRRRDGTDRREEAQARRYRHHHRRRMPGRARMAGASEGAQGRAGIFDFCGAGRCRIERDVHAGAVQPTASPRSSSSAPRAPAKSSSTCKVMKSSESRVQVQLKPVDRENWRAMVRLQTRPRPGEFRHTPALVACGMLRAQIRRELRISPIVIRDGEPSSVTDNGVRRGELRSEYWIDDIMIDAIYQGRGYGRAAMKQMLAMIPKRYPRCRAIKLTCFRANDQRGGIVQESRLRADRRSRS